MLCVEICTDYTHTATTCAASQISATNDNRTETYLDRYITGYIGFFSAIRIYLHRQKRQNLHRQNIVKSEKNISLLSQKNVDVIYKLGNVAFIK